MSLGDALAGLNVQPFFLHLPGGEPTDFEVQRFEVRETLHAPWSASVDFVFRGEVPLAPAAMLGKTGRLEITSPQGLPRSFVGVITAFEQGRFLAGYDGHLGLPGGVEAVIDTAKNILGAGVNDGTPTFRVQLASPLHKASLVQDFRIFEDKPLLDIARTLLAPYGVGLDTSALDKTYTAKLPLRVAYRETHLAFLQRLLARAGITFATESTPQGELLRLYDGAPDLADMPFLPFVARTGLVPTEEQIFALRRDASVTPAAVSLRGFHFLRPATPQQGQSGKLPPADGTQTAEIYDLDPQLQHDGQGRPMAQHRIEAQQWRGHFTHGQSTYLWLMPGRAWGVTSSGLLPFEGAYQAVSVIHRGTNPAWARGATGLDGADTDAPVYENAFVAIPAELVCRPPVPQGPRIVGVQTAKVVGPDEEEIHVDQHGRIRLKFPWDRSPPADDTTEGCWVRVGSSWAGKGWGALRLPRIGHEVVVHFEQGDPECPVVLGSVYNGRNHPPAVLPTAKTESVLRSATSLGSEGFHELRFDDAKGVERIAAHAERDHDIEVLRDRRQAVHVDEHTEITHDRARTIGEDQVLTVKLSDGSTIGGDSTLKVKQNLVQVTASEHLTTVLGQRTWKVAQDRHVTVAGPATRTVGGTLTSEITGGVEAMLDGEQVTELAKDAHRKYEASSSHVVAHRYSQELGQEKSKLQSRTTGSLEAAVRGELHRVALGPLSEEVGQDWTLSVKDGIVFTSKETRIEAETLTIRVGEKARLSISKSGEVALHGSKLFFDGKKTTLKGSKTNKVTGDAISNPKPEEEKEKKTEPFDYEIAVHTDGGAPVGTYRLFSTPGPDGKHGASDKPIDLKGSPSGAKQGLDVVAFKKVDPFATYTLVHEHNGQKDILFSGLMGAALLTHKAGSGKRRSAVKKHPKLEEVELPEHDSEETALDAVLSSDDQAPAESGDELGTFVLRLEVEDVKIWHGIELLFESDDGNHREHVQLTENNLHGAEVPVTFRQLKRSCRYSLSFRHGEGPWRPLFENEPFHRLMDCESAPAEHEH